MYTEEITLGLQKPAKALRGSLTIKLERISPEKLVRNL